MIFTRESLKQSIKPIILVILVCLFVWMWGNHRKVDISMTLRPEISGSEHPTKIDMTVYREDEVEATFSTQIASDRLAVQQLSLRPGTYFMRGIVSTASGNTHIVTQTIVVPDDNASIEIFLREK